MTRAARALGARWRAAAGIAAAGLLGGAHAGCDGSGATSGPHGSAHSASPATAAPTNAATPTASSSRPESGGLALGSSPTTAAVATSPFAGTWRASFEATRGEVSLAKDHPWPAWKKDAGTRLGKGNIELVVAADGSVTGTIGGALGELDLRGRLEDGTLRAGVTPKEPDEPDAMRGTLVGTAAGAKLDATLRASSGDGLVVRTAKLGLAKN